MATCPSCGLENSDFDSVCSMCGASLDTAGSTVAPKGKKIRSKSGKKLLISLVVGLAALGIGIGGAIIAQGLSVDAALLKAVNKTAASFTQSVDTSKDMAAHSASMIDLLDEGEYALRFEYELADVAVNADYDYSRKEKMMDGIAGLNYNGVDLSANFSVEDELLLVSSLGKMENVYGIKVDEISEWLESSPVGSFLPEEVINQIDVDFFKKWDIKNVFQLDSSKELKSFVKSTKVKYLDEKTISGTSVTIPCKVYQVTWDENAANKLLSAMKAQGGRAEIGAAIAGVILKLDPDIRCYVNEDGVLVGADLVSAGVRYVFLLEGEERLWDQFSLTITTLTGSKEVYMGGVDNSGDATVLHLKNEYTTFLELHLDENGDFALITKDAGEVLRGNISAASSATQFEIKMDIPELGETRLACSVSELKDDPEPLAEHYMDVLKMDISDWQRLLFDLGLLAS